MRNLVIAVIAWLLMVSNIVNAQDNCASLVESYGYTLEQATNRVSLGMFMPRAASFDDMLIQLAEMEANLGLPVGNIDVLIFNAWGDQDRSFPADLIAQAHAEGRGIILTSEPWVRDFSDPNRFQPEYSLESIANGDHDEYLRAWASQAAALGIPFIYRFAQEQSTDVGLLDWYPWQGDPEGYVAAFRHIHQIFQEEGATNIRFMWSAFFHSPDAPLYYPGDDVVDLIGTTVLNHGTDIPESYAQWFDFEYLMRSQYEMITTNWPGKTIYIAEMASAEQGGSKAQWLTEAFVRFAAEYTQVEGVSLIQGIDFKYPMVDWSINSSNESLFAMQAVVRCFVVR